jgi:hypothetical protein
LSTVLESSQRGGSNQRQLGERGAPERTPGSWLDTRLHKIRNMRPRRSANSFLLALRRSRASAAQARNPQPLTHPTRRPEDDETKTLTLAWQHTQHACMPLSEQRQRRVPAHSACVHAFIVRSLPLGADMVWKSRNSSADALFTQGPLALMRPTICCVRSQSAHDFASSQAVPRRHRCGVAQSSSSELAFQAHPSQPHSHDGRTILKDRLARAALVHSGIAARQVARARRGLHCTQHTIFCESSFAKVVY